MGYMYAAIWFIAGLVLVFRLAKENKIFYLAGAFFFVLGGWWLADAIQPAWQVFQGVPGIVLKVIAGVVLVILACGVIGIIRTRWAHRPAAHTGRCRKERREDQ